MMSEGFQTKEYIGAICRELKKMSQSADWPLLAYLLELAETEASFSDYDKPDPRKARLKNSSQKNAA